MKKGKAHKKPVTIEFMQFEGTEESAKEVLNWVVETPDVNGNYVEAKWDGENLIIPTLEGDHKASPGAYIIRGVDGEFYPCKKDIFERTYEIVS